MQSQQSTSPFYVTGGTLRPDAPSYVERTADTLLREALQAREFCYVLTSRQTGKSSLMVRTAARLREQGDRVAILDLTLLGQHLTREQWYYGLLDLLAEQLGLEDELEAFWSQHTDLGPAQRFLASLARVALPWAAGRLVIFIDEVDAVQALPFSTDEFFAGIRACYNRRATGDLEGLTFCLLGVAAPADLIQDPRTTPFNIGRRIELADFTRAEAASLAEGLRCGPYRRDAKAAHALLNRVLYWTNGHPSLTQQLCKGLAENGPLRNPREVDRICAGLFLSAGARRSDEHLLFVQERLLRAGDALPALLELLGRLLSGRVVEDRPGTVEEILRLAGIVRAHRGRLEIRNRIYARVFNRGWLASHLPDAEARRQQAAFRRGLLRAGAIAAIFIALLGGVAALSVMGEARTRQLASKLGLTVQQRDQLLGEREAMLRRLQSYVRQLTAERRTARSEARRAAVSESAERKERQVADAARQAAELQRTVALNLRQISDQQRRKIVGQLVRLQISAGENLLSDGRTLDALPWFVEALGQERESPSRSAGHRIRIASLLAQSPRLLRLWRGPALVRQLEFSPDGRRLVVGYSDGTLTVHDAANGARIGPAVRAHDSIYRLCFSPDSSRIALVVGYEVQIRSLSSGKLLGRTEHRPGEPLSAVFTQDGRALLFGLRGGTIWSWDFASGQPATEVAREEIEISSLLLSRGDRFLIVSSGTPSACSVWDWRSRKRIRTLRGTVASALSSADCLLTDDHLGYAFRKLPSLELVRSPMAGLSTLRFSQDGRRILAVVGSGLLEEWDSHTGERLTRGPHLPGNFGSSALSSDGSRAATAHADGVIRLWDPTADPPEHEIRAPVPSGFSELSPDRRRVALPGEDGRVRLFSTETGQPVGPALRHGSRASYAAFSADGRWIATAGVGGPPRLWDARTGQPARLRLQHPRALPAGGWIGYLAFSPGGEYLFAARSDFQAEVYNLRTGSIISPLIPCPHPPWRSSPFSPDGQWLLVQRGPWDALVWKLREGRFVDSRLRGTIPPGSLFSPDSRLLLGMPDGAPGFWDLRTGRRSGPPLPFGDVVGGMQVSPDGRRLATTGKGAVRIWDFRRRRPVLPPLEMGGVQRVDFSSDGRRLLTTSFLGLIRVWDAHTGEPLTPPILAPGVQHARFDATGERLIGLSDRGRVTVWRLRKDSRSVSELTQLAAVLTGLRLEMSSGLIGAKPENVTRAFTTLQMRYPQEFRASGQRELAWHTQKARAAEENHLWDTAVVHLNRLIVANPRDADLYARRAKAHAELAQWPETARDLQVLVRRGAGEPLTFYQLALAQLGAGDVWAYRRTCAAMLSRYEEFAIRYQDLATWTCALGPGAKPEIERAIKLVQDLVAKEGRNDSWLGTLGALQYRAGRPAEALKAFREARELRGNEGNPVDLLFYGLACRAVGKPSEARAALQRAREKRTEILRPSSGHHVDWQAKLTVQLLERELAEVP